MINSIKQKLEQINLIDTTDHKKAGVMIILLQNDNDSGIKILFTKRSSSLSTHSGEVSFPGGKWEEGDKDLYETALTKDQDISLTKDGFLKVKATVTDDMELRFWIRAFGDSVEVLKPKKLRDEFKQISKRMVRLYE